MVQSVVDDAEIALRASDSNARKTTSPSRGLRHVYVYADVGTSPRSVHGCMKWLKSMGHCEAMLHAVKAHDVPIVLRAHLPHQLALLIPGGADLPYLEKLEPDGVRAIRDVVSRGASYIGICAGAYFASSFCSFEPNDPKLRVVGPRPLALFSVSAHGAVRDRFAYDSESGATVERLDCEWSCARFQARVYCNGGAAWSLPSLPPDTVAIARYQHPVLHRHSILDASPVAVLQTKFGSGRVVLSGVHPEIFASSIDNRCPRGYPVDLSTAIVEAANL